MPYTRSRASLLVLGLLLCGAVVLFVRTRYRTPSPPPAGALQIEVYGHQWWWEFRYPQYNIVTANEIYLPAGRPVAFSLRSGDALQSFSIPQLTGDQALSTNAEHPLWFTPQGGASSVVWTGICTSKCGESGTPPRFLIFTVTPQNFTRWTRAQQAFGGSVLSSAAPPDGYVFPRSHIPPALIPHTPTPSRLAYNSRLTGVAGKGEMIFAGAGACITCHTVRATPLSTELGYPPTCMACHTATGNPLARGIPVPDLTHVASRATIAGGLYPNDAAHLALWIKNAPLMKPGAIMPTFGKGESDPRTRQHPPAGLDDQQIADLVAYLQVLK